MVEFAVVAPVFFALIFAMVNGGLLLFSMNAVGNATTVGSNSLAAIGNKSTADVTSLTKMVAQGLGNTGLIAPGEVDVAKLVASANGFATNPDGSPQVSNTCGTPPTSACMNTYTVSNVGGSITVTATNSTPYQPSSRNVQNGTSDFIELVVHYKYRFFFGIAPDLNLTATKTLRLEPQL